MNNLYTSTYIYPSIQYNCNFMVSIFNQFHIESLLGISKITIIYVHLLQIFMNCWFICTTRKIPLGISLLIIILISYANIVINCFNFIDFISVHLLEPSVLLLVIVLENYLAFLGFFFNLFIGNKLELVRQ